MKTFPFVSLIFAASASLFGQGVSTGGTTLKLPLTAASAAMGESDVAVPGLAGTLAGNPALIAGLQETQIVFTHLAWIQETQGQALAAATPVWNGLVGALGVSSVSIPGIEVREQPGPPIGSFTARSLAIRGALAYPLSDEIVAGVGMKYLYEKLYVDDASGTAFDLGGSYAPADAPYALGVSVSNLGSIGAFRFARTSLPTSVQAGGMYRADLAAFEFLGTAAVVRETHPGENRLRLGGMVSFRGFVALRFGYETGYDSRGLSAGIGLRLQFVRLDYAYIPFNYDLGNAHMISVGLLL